MSRGGWLASALSLVLLCGSWTHLELGAGNYGADGHTQASQSMTVLQKLQVVTDKENYIDGLDKTGRGNYCPETLIATLF